MSHWYRNIVNLLEDIELNEAKILPDHGFEDDEDFDKSVLGDTGTFTVYHASADNITVFKPFTHFGTKEAAIHRAGDLGLRLSRGYYLHEVSLTVKKSLWISDGKGNHTVAGMIDYLETILGLDFDDVDAALTAIQRGNDNKAAKLLMRYGYNALEYRNAVENAGSISWVVLNPKDIKILKVDFIRS